MPWLSEGYTKEELGIDPARCLVFLPSLGADSYRDLPVVPTPQSSGEDLPHKGKVKPPAVCHPLISIFKKIYLVFWHIIHTRYSQYLLGYLDKAIFIVSGEQKIQSSDMGKYNNSYQYNNLTVFIIFKGSFTPFT